MSYGAQLPQASAQTATTFSDEVLVAAQSGVTTHVASLFIHVDTAMTVTLESGGSTRLFECYPVAGGGLDLIFNDGQARFSCTEGESLTVTTDTTGNCFVLIKYWQQ